MAEIRMTASLDRYDAVRKFESTLPEEEQNLGMLIDRFRKGYEGSVLTLWGVGAFGIGPHDINWTLHMSNGNTMEGGFCYSPGYGWSSNS